MKPSVQDPIEMAVDQKGADNVSATATATATIAFAARRIRIAQLATVCMLVLIFGLVIANTPASAMIRHAFEGSFNGSDAPGGPFASVMGAAVDSTGGPSSGDVYIADDNLFEGVSVVNKFHDNGSYAGVQIIGTGTPQGSFSFLSFSSFLNSSIAVDNSGGPTKGDVYVADIGHGVVDRFSETGAFLCQITARAPTSRSAAEAEHECDGAAGSETPQGSTEPRGVAVSPETGNVYVADGAHAVVDEFSSTGAYMSQIADPHLVAPDGIAVDATGELYVSNGSLSTEPSSYNIVKFDAAGVFLSVVDDKAPTGVAVNPSTGHIEVYEYTSEPQIVEYDSAGNPLDSFGTGRFSQVGFALSLGVTGKTYAGQFTFNEGAVDIFGPAVVVPNVTTESATDVQQTGATLHGEADPDTVHGGGAITECKFEYGNSVSYGGSVACSPPTPYTTGTSVTADVTGLAPDTTYHFRLVAANANGVNEGKDETFITSGPPAVDNETATAITTSATVRAQIDPFGYETSCQVQYVTEAAFKSSGYAGAVDVPCEAPIATGFGDQPATATLSGLMINTVYHFRVIATSQAGTATGADQTFATFGIKSFSFGAVDGEKRPFAQAGGHPYEVFDTFALNTSTTLFENPGYLEGVDANPRSVITELPPGLIGNPDATSKCSPYNVAHADCSGASQVGIMSIWTTRTPNSPTASPIYNLVPPKGLAAQLGARFNGFVTVHIDAKVRTGGDYGVTAEALETSAGEGVQQVEVRLWGVPAEAGHDEAACPWQHLIGKGETAVCGRYCPLSGTVNEKTPCSERGPLKPFLTEPTACGGPLSAGMQVDSWQEPGAFVSASSEMPAITGCERLDFKPTIEARPTSASTDSSMGLNVDLHIPQIENPQGFAEAELRDATVALPAGLTVNPSAANGLEACSEAQMGYKPGTPSPVEFTPDPAQCPDASKIGSVEVLTPLLEHPLQGGVYLAQQEANPFKSLLALYIAIDDPQTGVVIKLAGEVKADPATGQLTTTFADNPQLPFEDFKLHFFSGSRASLASPSACGGYTTTTSLTPWSAPQSGGPATPSDGFTIDSGCAAGFAPSFTAGTASNAAGAFSPFLLSFSREDTEQQVGGLTFTMPPGVSAVLRGVPQCSNADAAAGTCPAASRIGAVLAGSGVGSEPYFLKGSVYLTGPYNGGPFGEVVVVPANAGPFHLGNVVVRGSIRIDPSTAQPTIVSDPLPQFVGSTGIPTDIRRVDVMLDRPGFTFNPTSCEALKTTGTLTSTAGAGAAVSQRFQAADCRALAFQPGFKVSTLARHSRVNGAFLHVVVTSGPGQANIKYVHVTLPKVLPSRLETLQHACADSVFAANPASCPAASRVGMASAVTPLLASRLSGPVYFVSHGGRAFPDLVVVLQGEGVVIELTGSTLIKGNTTTSTFASVPDAPVTRFDLTLPEGKLSALAATVNLCADRAKLVMPIRIVAQDGARVERRTKIAVSRCPKARAGKKRRRRG